MTENSDDEKPYRQSQDGKIFLGFHILKEIKLYRIIPIILFAVNKNFDFALSEIWIIFHLNQKVEEMNN